MVYERTTCLAMEHLRSLNGQQLHIINCELKLNNVRLLKPIVEEKIEVTSEFDAVMRLQVALQQAGKLSTRLKHDIDEDANKSKNHMKLKNQIENRRILHAMHAGA